MWSCKEGTPRSTMVFFANSMCSLLLPDVGKFCEILSYYKAQLARGVIK